MHTNAPRTALCIGRPARRTRMPALAASEPFHAGAASSSACLESRSKVSLAANAVKKVMKTAANGISSLRFVVHRQKRAIDAAGRRPCTAHR